VVSPWARSNFVDHTITDSSSTIKFIEDNWSLPRIGGGSNDATAGSIQTMFNFNQKGKRTLFLSPNDGQIVR
jgi:phospholipase C